MRNILIALILTITLFSCDESKETIEPISAITDSTSREQDEAFLIALSREIDEMYLQWECSDASLWSFTAVGSKACGGPMTYMAYPLESETEFLEIVQKYTEQQEIFNQKWHIISDCSVPAQPSGIICTDGKPEFVYTSN